MNATGGVQITPHRTHACVHFSRCVLHIAQFIQCTCIGSRYLSDSLCFSKVIPSATMSLLGVPEFSVFFPVFTSSTATPTSLTGIRLNPCATPLWGGPSGHLAAPTPNTGYEPEFCIDVSRTSTRRSIFLPERAVSSWRVTRQSPLRRTSSSRRHTPAGTVPILLKLGSLKTSSRKLATDYDSVASQTSSRKPAADVDHETIVPSVFESVSREKREIETQTL